MESRFHSNEATSFKDPREAVRAFTYTDYEIAPHDHDFYEMNIILGGTGIHSIEGETFPVARGDVFVIPPMTVHAYRNTDRLDVCHVLFKRDFIRENADEAVGVPGFLKLMEIEPFLRQRGKDAMFLRLSPSQMMEIQGDLRFIEDGGAFGGTAHLPLRVHTAWRLIYHLSYLLEKQAEGEGGGRAAKYRRQILDTLEYLHAHFAEKITVTALARRVYLSRSTLLRSFLAISGCSPTEYLSRYRLKKAAELLKASALSKTEVAHACGFYDLSHMERSLRREGL